MNFYARQAGKYRNTLKQSCSSLLGLVSGLLADAVLSDDEIRFLSAWLDQHSIISTAWPGDVLHARIKAALADGRITDEERAHLVHTVEQIAGGSLEQLTEGRHVNQLAFDDVDELTFTGSVFCLTGILCSARGRAASLRSRRAAALSAAVSPRSCATW